jgi:hypothetical protein
VYTTCPFVIAVPATVVPEKNVTVTLATGALVLALVTVPAIVFRQFSMKNS